MAARTRSMMSSWMRGRLEVLTIHTPSSPHRCHPLMIGRSSPALLLTLVRYNPPPPSSLGDFLKNPTEVDSRKASFVCRRCRRHVLHSSSSCCSLLFVFFCLSVCCCCCSLARFRPQFTTRRIHSRVSRRSLKFMNE